MQHDPRVTLGQRELEEKANRQARVTHEPGDPL
jgi:hypothetical protein